MTSLLESPTALQEAGTDLLAAERVGTGYSAAESRGSGSQPPRDHASVRRLCELSLIAISAVWGVTFVLVQDAIAVLPVSAFLAYRFLAAAAIVAVIFWSRIRSLSARGWCWGLTMGVALWAGFLSQTYALESTTVSNAGFITGLYVVITPILTALIFRRSPGRVGWCAAITSIVGLALLSGVGSGKLHPLGDGLALVSAIAFSAHIVLTSGGVRRNDVGALLAVQLGVSGLLSLILAGSLGEVVAPRGATVWTALAVTAVVASAIGFFIQSYAQQHSSPARTALILASEPLFAGIFGYLLAGDRMTTLGWIGGCLIVVAIVAIDAIPRLRPPRPLPES